MKKRVLSLMLAMAMSIGVCPTNASAANDTPVSGTGSGASTTDPRYFDDYASMKDALEDESVIYAEYIHISGENLTENVTEPIKIAGEKKPLAKRQ